MSLRKSFRINPFLWALYHLLRVVAWICVRVFFRRFVITGREHLRDTSGPIIVVVNHPSTLMDVLAPGAYINRVMFFLANYGLFKNPISNVILRTLYCIPVKRKEDVAEGENRNNDSAFEQSFRHLEKGGALFVAPEGVSWMNRMVRPFKTGTARIALGAEQRQNGNLGVRILPVGLTYNAPHHFRSNLVMQVGEPIEVSDWLAAWSVNPTEAVDDLTLHTENIVRSLAIHAGDEDGDALLHRIEAFLQAADPLPFMEDFHRSKTIADRIAAAPVEPAARAAYYRDLEHEYITGPVPAPEKSVIDYIFLIVGFPLTLVGLAFWFLPCFIPWWLNKKLNLYIGYSSTVKVLAGFFITFPLAIWGVWRIGQPYFTEWWKFPAVLIAFGLLGLGCEIYLDRWKKVMR